MDGGISPEEYETWILASDAKNRVTSALHDWSASGPAILDRLCEGLIRAVAKNGKREVDGRQAEMQSYVPIPPWLWKDMMKVYVYPNHHAFWTSNDAVWEITDRSTGFSKRKTFKFFGIRFDPAGIAELDRQQSHAVGAPAPPAPAITPPSPDKMPVLAVNQAEDEPAQPKPRLSDPALTAWFAAYELAYTKGERTLDHAWDHAKRAFPEKSVTRDRVRALMAGGKPGPRPRG